MPEMKTPFPGAVSIARFISTSGYCSYQSAVQLVESQRVFLNNTVISDFWLPVNPESDIVRVNEQVINPDGEKKYYAFHKPEGFISSHSDGEGFPTIYEFFEKQNITQWLTTAGRLDVETSGLMILTNDTKFVKQLSHPETKISKIYELTLDGICTDENLKDFKTGVVLGNGYVCLPADYKIIYAAGNITKVELTLIEGKKRQIRRMCRVLKLRLTSLKRIQMGNYKLGQLEPGDFIEIRKSDII